jgi:hypothetical protein
MSDPMVLSEGTKRFTPDDAHYHQPDDRQRYLLGGGITGDYAVIPGSYGKNDGRSKGFDHNVPDVVCVDPDEKGGNIVVDLANIDKATYQRVFAKHGAEDPVKIFAELSAAKKLPTKRAAAKADRVNHLMPNTYIVPKADSEGSPEDYVIPANTTSSEPVLPPIGRPAISEASAPQPTDSNNLVIAQLMAQVSQLAAMMQSSMARSEPVPSPVTKTVKPEESVMSEDAPDVSGSMSYETLEIPFVTGPVPQKAKTQVFIELPGFGSMSTWFHGIFTGDGCVVLVYDTRYADGQQFCPPYNQETHPDGLPLKVIVPAPKPNKTKEKDKIFDTKYFGLKFAFGVFDCIILVTVDKDDAEAVDD